MLWIQIHYTYVTGWDPYSEYGSGSIKFLITVRIQSESGSTTLLKRTLSQIYRGLLVQIVLMCNNGQIITLKWFLSGQHFVTLSLYKLPITLYRYYIV